MTQRVIDQCACHCPCTVLETLVWSPRLVKAESSRPCQSWRPSKAAIQLLQHAPSRAISRFPLRLPVQMMRMSPLSPKQRRHSHLWRQPRTVGNLLVSREIASFTNGRIPCNNSRLRGKWPGVFFTRMSKLANYRYLVINTCATGCEKRLSSEESMWRVDEESFSQPVSGFTTCLSGMYRPFLRPILLIFHTGVPQSI